MKRGRVCILVSAFAGMMLLSACELGSRKPPVKTYTLLSAATQTAPISVAAPLVARQTQGTQYNQWGGIVPDAKPTTPVDDGSLGELYN